MTTIVGCPLKHKSIVLYLSVLLLLAASCRHKMPEHKQKLMIVAEPYGLEFDRYEDVLFNLDTADFQQGLLGVQERYGVFLSGNLDNPDAVKYIKDFATDRVALSLYNKVCSVFPDLSEVKPVIEGVMGHFHYYYPEIELPKKVFTCVSGVTPDIPPVQIIDKQLVVSLDWYLNQDEIYDQIGMPRYMSVRTSKAALAKDVAKQLYMYALYDWRKQGQVINEMVYNGRLNFFIEAMCPDLADNVLLGYSEEQMIWAQENEGQVWADIVGNRYLYETGLDAFMMFFGDGPFTQRYGNDAPSRLGDYFGLQIIRSFVANHDDYDLKALMQRNDLVDIFQDSGYKPRK